jgi:hypothetical protein
MQNNFQTPHFQSMQPQLVIQETIPDIQFDCTDGQPLQLVRLVNGRTFEIVQETADFLTRELEGGVAVCSIVGKYRTGKSFLLNRLLNLNEHNGFNVSASINACTKGLWIWSKPVYIPKDNLNIIFMDTEGLDSVDRNSDTDARLFSLTVLLSSYFIYNSIGAIDEMSINTLSLITYLIKTVALEENKSLVSEYQLSQFAPKLLWILRDFILEIKDTQGRIVTAPQYLESALVDVTPAIKGSSRDTQKSYQIRQSLINFFKSRDCLTLVRPVNDESELRNIQHLRDEQIRPDFLNSLNAIRNKIYKNCTQKVINGVGMNTNMLVVYLRQFVEAFNSGRMPVIQTAWKSLMESECRNHFERAIRFYEEEVKQLVSNVSMPDQPGSLKKVELYKNLGYFRDLTLNYYNKCYYIRERDPDLFDKYKLRLKELIAASEKRVLATNSANSQGRNADLLGAKVAEFVKLVTPERMSEEELAEEINSQIFEVYATQNYGGEESQDFAEAFPTLAKNLLEWYASSTKQDSLRKKNSMARNQSNEAEKIRVETEQLKTQFAKLDQMKRDLLQTENKIAELSSGAATDRIYKLKEEQMTLNGKLQALNDADRKNATELGTLNVELDRLTKRKKGC